ncbi:uncharacterized protein [Panulirus ornatus]|uniref:uncharacterized protein isoform X3 n=1 Tax=Panulirus ornatus TaxID=150431 RepID=UPI003A89B4E7
MDTTGSSEEVDTSLESLSGEQDQSEVRSPHRPSPFTLRSQCAHNRCPMGTGILFRSRISPSPSKQRVRGRRRRRSDQSRLDTTGSNNGTSLLEVSHDLTHDRLHRHNHDHYHDHPHHHHDHHHNHHQYHNGVHALDHHHHCRHHTPDSSPHHTGDMLKRSSLHRKKETTETSSESTTTSSQTVVDYSRNGGPQLSMNGGIGGLAETVKNSVFGFLTPSKEKVLPAIVESSESGYEEGSVTGETVVASSPVSQNFVSAREFFAEADTRDRLTSDYFSGTDTPSKIRESTRRLSLRKPFNQYIAYSSDEELDDWQQQPKSDYTYSESLTYRDRVTPDRKIGSPNMSRRGLRVGDTNYVQSTEFSAPDLSFDSSHLNLRTRTVLRPMDALSDTSDGEEVQEQIVFPRRTRSSRSRSIDVMPKINGSAVTRTITTTSFTTTRTLHRGLDTESDVDDGTESTVPMRATPLTARSGTPLGRAGTPVNRSHMKSTLSVDTSRGGYTLAKGAIAEDVEEEENPKSTVVSWTKKTWQNITRITTLITTSFVMMAARAVTSTASDSSDVSSTSEKTARYSILSTINTTRRKMTTVTTEFFESIKDRVKKNPILLWIPLLFILLLLALVAYWWLLQSRAKTDDTTDPTETDGASFLPFILTSASDLTHWVIHSISFGIIFIWESMLGMGSWFASACSSGLTSVWVTLLGMFSWLGSVVDSCLAYMLKYIYLMLEYLQYLALAILNFISVSVSYISGIILPIIANNETTEETQTVNAETQSWSVITWVSSFSPREWISQGYESLEEIIQASGNWLRSSWLWLVLNVTEALSTTATFILWLISSLWSLGWQLVSGLWTLLTYIIISIIGVLTSAATTVSSLAIETSSAVASNVKLFVIPLIQSSETTSKETSKMVVSPQKSKDILDNEIVGIKSASVEEVVNKVLSSVELKTLIAAIASESFTEKQLTIEGVSGLVKRVVEGELGVITAETAAVKEEIQIQTVTTAETRNHVLSLKEQQEHLLRQVELLEAGLVKKEGLVEVDQEQLEAHRQVYEEQLVNLRKQIEHLSIQLNELQNDHASLATEVKSCCRNTSVTLADVERHVIMLLGDVLGLPGSPTSQDAGRDAGVHMSLSANDVKAWLKSYFVAKEELETRLNSLMATMQAKNVVEADEKEASVAATEAAVTQTAQIVMETVLEKLRAEINRQHAQFSELSKQQVAEEVKLQVETAATVLGQQVSEQLQHQLQISKQQLQKSITDVIKDIVEEYVASAVPEAVATAVPGAVAVAVTDAIITAVPDAVNGAVIEVVNAAVDKAVTASVSDAVAVTVPDKVNAALPNAVADAVSQAVANAVPKAIAEALPDAVNTAVHETVTTEVQGFVAVAVPEVVASVLPSAVSIAVNESVSSAIAEALMELKVNKAGYQISKEEQSGGEGVATLAGSSSSTISNDSATVSATVNISHSSNNNSDFFAPVELPFTAGLNESAVIRIVKEALMKYDADKTGMVDHALESAGGNIVSTRCTESYQVHQAEVSILGFPIYRYSTNNPRTIIQPDRMPGQCWAFKGSQGYIVIQLAGFVKPTGFSLEHIPKSLSPTGEIDSAPQDFEVWGLTSENDEGVYLGSYKYDENGEPLQSFMIKEQNTKYFPLVELKINSNHGNMQYTCLYRFRVHGIRHL